MRKTRAGLLLGVLLLAPSLSEAQLPVVDKEHIAVSSATAANTFESVGLQEAMLAELQKMLYGSTGSFYEMPQYLKLIQEVIDSMRGGEAMHYYLGGLDGKQKDLFRGFTSLIKGADAVENFALLAETNLNVQRGMLNTVHEELRVEDDIIQDLLLLDLKDKTAVAEGIRGVGQVGNYIAIEQIQEDRRQRHMLGALTNALVIEQEHRGNLEAWGWAVHYEAAAFSDHPLPGPTGRGVRLSTYR